MSPGPAPTSRSSRCRTGCSPRSGVPGVTLRLNSIGDAADRAAYRDLLRDFLHGVAADLSPDARRRIDDNPLRVLDSKADADVVAAAPVPLDHLGAETAAHFAAVRAGLDGAGIAYEIAPRLVRGLDYYNRTVFELFSSAFEAAQASLGGGRPLRPARRAHREPRLRCPGSGWRWGATGSWPPCPMSGLPAARRLRGRRRRGTRRCRRRLGAATARPRACGWTGSAASGRSRRSSRRRIAAAPPPWRSSATSGIGARCGSSAWRRAKRRRWTSRRSGRGCTVEDGASRGVARGRCRARGAARRMGEPRSAITAACCSSISATPPGSCRWWSTRW